MQAYLRMRQTRMLPKTEDYTYLEWVMRGYRVLEDATIVGHDPYGEPLYSYEDVEKEDRDL